MKKFIIALVLTILLGGCSGAAVSPSEVAKMYAGDFSAKANVTFYGNEAAVEIAKNPMSISILFTKPEELAGLEVEVFDEHAKFAFEGMEQEIRTDNIPDGAVFMLLKDLFENLDDPDDFFVSTENGNLKIRDDDFSAVLSGENFALISADFPEYSTVFEFSDFSFSGAQ